MQKEYWSVHEIWYKFSDHSEELNDCMEVAMSKIKTKWSHNKILCLLDSYARHQTILSKTLSKTHYTLENSRTIGHHSSQYLQKHAY